MRPRTIEFCTGLVLLLGPLVYALTLEPEVIEVVRAPDVVAARPVVEPAAPATCEQSDAPDAEPACVAPAPVTPTPDEPAAVASDLDGRMPFAFVNGAGLVLSTTADPAWGRGSLRAHGGPGQYRAAKQVDVAKLPEALWAQRAHTFDVYGPSGKLCTARLGELSVLAQHNGPSLFEVFHGSMDAIEWDAEAGDEDPLVAFERETPTAKQIRAKVWSSTTLGTESVWLVAALESDTSCQGGLWARDAELPPPVTLHRAPGPLPITEQRIAAHETSAELAAVKRAYEEWRNEIPEDNRAAVTEWATIEREHPARALAWLDDAEVPRLVELDFGRAPDGCGDLDATRISAVDIVVDGKFKPTEHAIDPLAVFDINLDSRFELLYADTLVSDTPELIQHWTVFEEYYCPC